MLLDVAGKLALNRLALGYLSDHQKYIIFNRMGSDQVTGRYTSMYKFMQS